MVKLCEYCRMLGLYAALGRKGVIYTFTDRPKYIDGYYTLNDYDRTAKLISTNVERPKLTHDMLVTPSGVYESVYAGFIPGTIIPKQNFSTMWKKTVREQLYDELKKLVILDELANMYCGGKK